MLRSPGRDVTAITTNDDHGGARMSQGLSVNRERGSGGAYRGGTSGCDGVGFALADAGHGEGGRRCFVGDRGEGSVSATCRQVARSGDPTTAKGGGMEFCAGVEQILAPLGSGPGRWTRGNSL